MVGNELYFFLSQQKFFYVSSCWKRTKNLTFFLRFITRKIDFETLIFHSFEEQQFSPIDHMNHMKIIFQDQPFYCTKKVQQNHNKRYNFCQRVGTPFLVLAQTLIYVVIQNAQKTTVPLEVFLWYNVFSPCPGLHKYI